MKRAALAILLLAASATAFAADSKSSRPDWCKPGWECIPTKELALDAAHKIDLSERLALAEAKLKARHFFGWHTTCGVGVAVVATEKFDAKAAPAGYCGIGWGF